MSEYKSVCLITGGYTQKNLRLQPWRYLSEVAQQLAGQGHAVTVITDSDPNGSDADNATATVDGVTVRRIPSVNRYWWQHNATLRDAVQCSHPSVILWHLGLPSFLHQRIDGWPAVPVLGIFPGLVYKPAELWRLGIKRLAKGYKLSAIHVAGMLVPRQLVRGPMTDGRLNGLVVQTQSTCRRLIESGVHPGHVRVIPPGVDEIWATTNCHAQCAARQRLGYTEQDKVILFFGSPAPLRGLHSLIRAVALARESDPSIKLLVLNRRRRDELIQEDAELRRLLENSAVAAHIHVISGFLPPLELSQQVAATDIVALPFELVPADAPLSILEAQALGKPIVTTRVASLPEMAAAGTSYLAEPADPMSLANALLKAAADLDQKRRNEQTEAPKRTIRTWQKVGEEWSQLLQAF